MARPNRGGNRRSARRARRPVRGYTLRGPKGRIRYVGVTDNPSRRAAQHRREGKIGKMHVENSHVSRTGALSWERRKLAAYRTYHRGKNPPLNKTLSGSWRS